MLETKNPKCVFFVDAQDFESNCNPYPTRLLPRRLRRQKDPYDSGWWEYEEYSNQSVPIKYPKQFPAVFGRIKDREYVEVDFADAKRKVAALSLAVIHRHQRIIDALEEMERAANADKSGC